MQGGSSTTQGMTSGGVSDVTHRTLINETLTNIAIKSHLRDRDLSGSISLLGTHPISTNGGYGDVWKGRLIGNLEHADQTSMECTVAIKVVRRSNLSIQRAH